MEIAEQSNGPADSVQTARRDLHAAAALIAVSLICATGTLGAAPPPHIASMLRAHCVDCHGPDKQKGDLRFDTLEPNFTDPTIAAHWTEAMDRVNSGDMPPKKVTARPALNQISEFSEWVTAEVRAVEANRRAAGGAVVMRRLNRAEYSNTMRDLFGIAQLPPFTLPEDNAMLGFNNIGSSLVISPTHMEAYLKAATAIVEDAIVTGKPPETSKVRIDPEKFEPKGKKNLKDSFLNFTIGYKGETTSDAILMHSGSVTAMRMPVPSAGRYMLRVRAAKAQPDQDNLSFVVQDTKLQTTLLSTTLTSGRNSPQLVEQTLYLTPVEDQKRGKNELPYVNLAVLCDFSGTGRQDRRGNATISDMWLDYIELEGPIVDAWPPASQTRWFDGKPEAKSAGEAHSAIQRFMARAYRRPPTPEELSKATAIIDGELKLGEPVMEALKLGMTYVLCAPGFLYLEEPQMPGQTGARILTDYEIAARLSYFIWSSMPDDTLFALAAAGKLRNVEALRQQVARMILDPRSRALADGFCNEWLQLDRVRDFTPDKKLYTNYDPTLEAAMVQETKQFFTEILRKKLDVRAFLQSDFTMLNERLARHYGIEGVSGGDFQRVALKPDSHRGGLLGQASILKLTSDCQRTKPVARGKWILENILNSPPPKPPPNVGEFEPTIPGAAKLSTRQRLAAHRETIACASCHQKIDPLGFALENYDATGAWRTTEKVVGKGKDPEVDSSGQMPDGRKFKNLAEFQRILVADEMKFIRCLTEKLFIYALGRPPEKTDTATLDRLAASLKQHRRLDSLIAEIVTTKEFVTK